MLDLNYKGWIIAIVRNLENNTSVSCTIRNEKFGKVFRLTKKCPKATYHYVEHYYGIFSEGKTEYQESTFYNENEAINDLIVEAKAIVDMFEEMEKSLTTIFDERLIFLKRGSELL